MPALPGLSTLPVAVSPLVHDLVGHPAQGLGDGPTTAATVLAAFPTALYLHVPAAHGSVHCVLPVLTSDALRLPTGLVLARHSRQVEWPVVAGDEVLVGEGRVRLPGVELFGVRTWRPARVETRSAWDPQTLADGAARAHAGAVGGAVPGLVDACAGLVRAARDGADVRPRVGGLVGAGQGLTPSGDDALCGALLALRAFAPDDVTSLARLADATRAATHRTTCLSASLLHAAIDGYATPQVVRLLSALSALSAPQLGPALAAVLAIGHSSGRDLVAGIAGTLHVLTTDSLSQPRTQPDLVLQGAHHA